MKKKVLHMKFDPSKKLIEKGLRSINTYQGYIQNSKAAASQTTEAQMGEQNHDLLNLIY